MVNRIFSIIANKDAKEAELVHAIQELGAVTESPGFWTDIANSSEYSGVHRRHCVFQLFRRHVSIGMKLSKLAQMLNAPSWLQDKDIFIVEELSGKIPVKWTFDDTVFVLHVLPGSANESSWAIYLRVSGKIERESFIQLIRGKHASQRTNDAIVLEIGFNDGSVNHAALKE